MSAARPEFRPEFRDPADLPQAAVHDHPADKCLEAFCERCASVVDAACPRCRSQVAAAGVTTKDGSSESSLERSEFYRRFVNLVQTSRNAKFTLVCYLIATGDGYAQGVSMTEVARQWKVGKATVSKQCHLICAQLGIRPSRYMRAEETSATFRASNRRPRKL